MPATQEDFLMAEMAVQTGFVTRDKVDACLGDLESGAARGGLAAVLLERGHIDGAQQKLLASLVDKKPVQPAPEARDDEDADFDRLVEIKRLAAAGEVEKIMQVIKEMRGSSRFKRLGQILLKKSMLNAEQMHALLEEKGIRVMRCPKCKKTLQVKNYQKNRRYGCGRCKVVLEPVAYDEIPIPDDDFEVVVEEG